jgi:cold shock CspA family protein
MLKGKIVRIVSEKKFGFLVDERGDEHFYHKSDTRDFESLRRGDEVSFEVLAGKDGRTKAKKVCKIVPEGPTYRADPDADDPAATPWWEKC